MIILEQISYLCHVAATVARSTIRLVEDELSKLTSFSKTYLIVFRALGV